MAVLDIGAAAAIMLAPVPNGRNEVQCDLHRGCLRAPDGLPARIEADESEILTAWTVVGSRWRPRARRRSAYKRPQREQRASHRRLQ